jgi:myo-inositol-1(or 4)-monophosphatase
VAQHTNPVITQKLDGSPVTPLDLELSHHIEKIISETFPEATFYSEEKYSEFKFPLIALDPLDGTREYIARRPEWAISIAHFENDGFEGQGWVFNPSTGEIFKDLSSEFKSKERYIGEVSHSEWNKGLYQSKFTQKFSLHPMGSIAHKLARLSNGKSDFVISLFPKNIWDVAAGTLLCKQAGLKFYSQGIEVTKVQKSYEPPLIWCHESLFSELSALYS